MSIETPFFGLKADIDMADVESPTMIPLMFVVPSPSLWLMIQNEA